MRLEENMRPLFTIHAGEFLVADYIERNYAKPHRLRVWVPSKDNGIDLLVTSDDCSKTISIQVKFSKCFDCEREFDASGWWRLNRKKIESSPAEYWVFALPKFNGERTFSDCFYCMLRPRELLKRLRRIHGDRDSYNMYLTVKGCTVIESRELKKRERNALFARPVGDRDFSSFLCKWDVMLKGLI